jgi:hypothetical protein
MEIESTVESVLIRAKAKIKKFENWTQGSTARDSVGTEVHWGNNRACSWCSIGAINYSVPKHAANYYTLRDEAEALLGSVIGEGLCPPSPLLEDLTFDSLIVRLNDSTLLPAKTIHSLLMSCFDEAIFHANQAGV